MQITTLCRAICLLQEARKGSLSFRLLHELRLLRQRFSTAPSEARDVTINRLKMELRSKVEKARRLEKNRESLRPNSLFQRDARRFYRDLGKQTIHITSPPSVSEIEQCWSDILETEVCHNKSALWLRRQINGEMSQTVEQQCNLSQTMRSPCVSKGWGTGSLLGQIRFTVFGSSVSSVFTVI